MINSTVRKLSFIFLLAINSLLFAQPSNMPNPGENPESGGGPGASADVPIDMYQLWLFAIGIFAIYFLAKKYKNNLA